MLLSVLHENVVTASRQSFGYKATKVAITKPFRDVLIVAHIPDSPRVFGFVSDIPCLRQSGWRGIF
jgi:hypothetical protein